MKHNESTGCSVTKFKYHYKDDDYCTLIKIKVYIHESTPRTVEYTDCESFELD